MLLPEKRFLISCSVAKVRSSRADADGSSASSRQEEGAIPTNVQSSCSQSNSLCSSSFLRFFFLFFWQPAPRLEETSPRRRPSAVPPLVAPLEEEVLPKAAPAPRAAATAEEDLVPLVPPLDDPFE